MGNVQAVVSGGGLVGLAVALMLSRHDRDVLLLDQPQPSTIGELGLDLRSVALSPAAIALLADLGFETESGTPITCMRVWERDGTADIEFRSDEVDAEYLAKVFQNHQLVQELRRLAAADTNIRIEHQRIAKINPSNNEITLDDGHSLRSRLLVIAEGARSGTAGLVGVRRNERSLGQHAVVSVLRMSREHQGVATQRFGDTPLALLPYAEPHVVSMIWSLPVADAERIQRLDDAAFKSEVDVNSESRLGEVEIADRRMSFPLVDGHVRDMNPRAGILIIGDSARTIHPLAGQGVNLGLEDVRSVGRVLETNPDRLDEPGLWRDFALRRKIRSKMVSMTMRGFSDVWQIDQPLFRLIRNTGVNCVAGSPWLKLQLMREAMGVAPVAKYS